MEILIHHKSTQPIYEQIVQQVKEMIMTGELKPGDPIASVRALAKELRVGVLTVQKAYDRLQQEQIIESVVGKGSFVSNKNISGIEAQREQIIEAKALELIELSEKYKVSKQELFNLIETLCDHEG